MAADLPQWEKDDIAREILAYLADHPDSQDTFEGIVQWWLQERKIKYQEALVKEALDELISEKLIQEHPNRGSETRYQINRQKSEDVCQLPRRKKE